MQDIFLLGVLGALLPPPFPEDLYDEEHPHDERTYPTKSGGTESE